MNTVLFYIIIFLTNVIQGITGFAGTILAMPPSLILVGYDVAKPILNVLGILAGVYVFVTQWKHVDWKQLKKVVIVMAIGIFGGFFLKNALAGYDAVLYKFLGIFVIFLAIHGFYSIYGQRQRDTKEKSSWKSMLLLIGAGIVHGMFVSGGPLLIGYLSNEIKEKTSFRATISTVWIILNSMILVQDIVTIARDTSGDSLHKRGYRPAAGKAPISETLAAALIMLTPWRGDRILVDPFCGSGTFPIEAAMIAANIAPGMNRKFTAQKWTNIIDKQLWYDAVDEAEDMINLDVETDIQGFDIDADVIRKARSNAENAGVEKLIHFQERSVADLSHHKKYGFIITNPPYGERLEDKETLPGIYSAFGRQFAKLDSWSAYMITSYEDAVKYFGRKPDKNRKIYNGMLKTYFYSFQGPKPPKKEKGQER